MNGVKLNRDNSKLHIFLEDAIIEGQKNVMVVFDASAYGSFYHLLIKTIKTYDAEVSILSWDSFENYVLASPYFGKTLTKQDVACNYNSLEQLSTQELKQLVPGYDKKALPKLLEDKKFIYGILTTIV